MVYVLIVDDSSMARLFTQRCLKAAGFDQAMINFATNGQEALDILKKGETDLLITDINMPVMDGETLLRHVRFDPKLADLPVLFVSSAVNPAKVSKLIAQGACGVLDKPVTPESLLKTIPALVQKKGQADG